ncbi:hypothetical protein DAPPUDRAFT_262737 [Daphnia pulex]|uniref:Uncharacterized protein n=1 Tax=Daphnia pulex TaxID=6669 RepID=E9HNK8_DAPPU|nr:hypothetical protein DAPPUDRAFT_262737 [Daphnia pulex]|eukprot:EFX66686.1 hypothetical protein DAPPUDRAFT_262737 [Daphnia pulex]
MPVEWLKSHPPGGDNDTVIIEYSKATFGYRQKEIKQTLTEPGLIMKEYPRFKDFQNGSLVEFQLLYPDAKNFEKSHLHRNPASNDNIVQEGQTPVPVQKNQTPVPENHITANFLSGLGLMTRHPVCSKDQWQNGKMRLWLLHRRHHHAMRWQSGLPDRPV